MEPVKHMDRLNKAHSDHVQVRLPHIAADVPHLLARGFANQVFSSLDDWQAAIIRAELKAELAGGTRRMGR